MSIVVSPPTQATPATPASPSIAASNPVRPAVIPSGKSQFILIYGASDTGKTSQLGEIARYLINTRGWEGRLLTGDSSYAPLADLIQSPENPNGQIEAFDLALTTSTLEVMSAVGQGYWPKIVGNEIRLIKTPPDRAKRIKFMMVEGAAVVSQMLMAQMIRNKLKIAEDVVGSYELTLPIDGSPEKFKVVEGQAGRAHYNHIHNILRSRLWPAFKALPLEYCIWTSHESKGDDDLNKALPALGPATIGKALVSRTTENFAHAFRLDVDYQDPKNPDSRVFKGYFLTHPEPSVMKAFWPCKVSLSLEKSAKLRKQFPGGFIPLGQDAKGKFRGMEQFMEFLEKEVVVGYANQGQAPAAGPAGK